MTLKMTWIMWYMMLIITCKMMSMMTSVCDAKWRRLVIVSDYVDDKVDVDIWWRCLMAMSGGDDGENVLNHDMENDIDVDDDDGDDV